MGKSNAWRLGSNRRHSCGSAGVGVILSGAATIAAAIVGGITAGAGVLAAANNVAEIVEVFTGQNFIRDSIFGGSQSAYNLYSGIVFAVSLVGTIYCGNWLRVNQTTSNVGNSINGMPQASGRITGYTKHGINSAISHDGVGVSTRAILDTVKNPSSVVYDAARKTFEYTSSKAFVVLNTQGKVVTTYARSSLFWRIL